MLNYVSTDTWQRPFADAFVLAECTQGGSSSAAAGSGSSRLGPSSGARITFSSMESAVAALEAGDEGPDPRQHIRVQCWGEDFFVTEGGHDAVSADSTVAGPASGGGSGGSGSPPDANTCRGAAPAVSQQLVSVYRVAAMHCYMALHEAEQMLAEGNGAYGARRLQVPLLVDAL
jgi:hypothetical protein